MNFPPLKSFAALYCYRNQEIPMHALSLRPSSIPYAPRPCAPGSHLTSEEWELILKALRAYKHNAAYRQLYDKLVSQSA